MAGAQQSSRETQRCIEKARSERHGPNTLGCKHPQNLEYALFFDYVMKSSVERNGVEAQWSKTLFKIVGSLRKLPSRVRSLEHANAIHGVGPKTLDLFRMYLTAHPPDPPSDAELLADERAAEATRAAKDAEKARKKAEREAKKRAAGDAREKSARARSETSTPRTPADDLGSAARRRYDPRGVDDDIVAIVLDESPPGRGPSEPTRKNRRSPKEPSKDADAAPPPKRARAPAKARPAKPAKPARWEPGYRTAPFALLATLHKLHLQGETTVGKKRLMDAAEASGLSAQGIYPKGNDLVHSARGDGGYRGDGARFAYSGWSCFSKQLAKAPKGWPAPMVMTWSNPVQIRLTDEGKMLGAWMHAAAETRGDCACGLMSAETVARAEAERRRIVFGAAEPDERAPDARESAFDAHTAEAGESAAPDAAALRRERARAATRAEIASIKASARGEAPSAPPSGAREDARSPPRARAAAAAETRRSTDLHAPRASAPAPAPSDDDVVVLDDDEDEADERDLPPFLSVSERRRSSPDDDAARPRGTRDADASPRTVRPSAAAATRGGVRAREHPAMGAVAGRAPRLPPISAGKTFADEYEVVLVVDNREQFGGGRRAAGQSRSEHRLEEVRRIAAAHGVAAEVGHLECGDATWVARRRRGNAGAADDYVLDLAVERKSLEDLKLSIQDDRYRQQKFFLKRSGLRNLGYLVEGDFGRFADRPDVSDQSAKAVASAATQTEVWDGFTVIRTEDVKETFDVLARMTLAMRDRFALARAEDGAAARAIRSGDEEETRRLTPLTLAEYNANLVVAKRSLSTLKNVWGSMLMSTTGLGPEYAQAITDRFPTPGALNAAYADAGSAEAAAALLAHTPVSGNRTVGPVVSKRVYATLFGHELTPLA